MYCTRKLQDDLFWVGANDRRLALFENVFPIPRGVSYNAYLLLDEKTALLDTVDASVAGQFFENLAHALGGRKLDYLIVNHMEPDHCATLAGRRGADRARGRHAGDRPAHARVYDGADGALAGGHGHVR